MAGGEGTHINFRHRSLRQRPLFTEDDKEATIIQPSSPQLHLPAAVNREVLTASRAVLLCPPLRYVYKVHFRLVEVFVLSDLHTHYHNWTGGRAEWQSCLVSARPWVWSLAHPKGALPTRSLISTGAGGPSSSWQVHQVTRPERPKLTTLCPY